jgi:integrase
MNDQYKVATVKGLLETSLAKPWHYRRSGVYYLRVRPVGSSISCTVSLRTTDRPTAMTSSRQLQAALRTFHLDNPESTWPEIRDQLRELAADILATPTDWEALDVMGLNYSDLSEDLSRIGTTAGLTVAQAKAVPLAREIMWAAERRMSGNPTPLVKVIDRIDEQSSSDRLKTSSLSLSVSPLTPPQTQHEPLTFKSLSDLYMAEHQDKVQPSTMRDARSSCAALSEALGDLDLRVHTRSDLVTMRGKLLGEPGTPQARKPATVNKLLTRLSAVMVWAVNTGHLERTYDKGLKISGKASQSTRKAFSPSQIESIMTYANGLAVGSWERWALSLGVITGARIGEIRQLTKEDVKQVGGTWVVDINDNEGKQVKTSHSIRLVPLIDGACEFDLEAFHQYIAGTNGLLLFPLSEARFSEVLNGSLRAILQLEARGNLTFHSLRHSLSSLLKSHAISPTIAEAITGHASQSITFDLYGGGQKVGIEKLKDALEEVFGISGMGSTASIRPGNHSATAAD